MNGTLNKVMLIGNVGTEVKMHQFDNGNKLARFPLATSESYTARETGERIEQTEWHNVVVNRSKLAEVFERYVKKGDKLYIEGKLRTRKYMGNDGQERYTTEVLVDNFTFLSPKSGTSGYSAPEGGQTVQSKPEAEKETEEDFSLQESEDTDGENSDDLPF